MPKLKYSSMLRKIMESSKAVSKLGKNSHLKQFTDDIEEKINYLKKMQPIAHSNKSLNSIKTNSIEYIKQHNSDSSQNAALSDVRSLPSHHSDIVENTSVEGTRIKNNVIDILKTKYENIGVSGLFDRIDNETIERNIEVAESSLQSNLKHGNISSDKMINSYPNLLDGMTMFYAASEKGDKTAANKAYEAAYMKPNNTNDCKADLSMGEFQTANESYLNKSEDNKSSIYIGNTKIVDPEYSKIYHGDTWLGKPQLDLNCEMLSQTELRKMKWISWMDFNNSEKDHIANLRWIANMTSVGEMKGVINDMITHFLDGSGSDYYNKTLTQIVAKHKTTKSYMSDFTKVFKSFLENSNGNIEVFANSKEFKQALKNSGVLLSTYSYKGLDTFTGLRMAIHGWTESDVDVHMLEILPDGSYNGKLKFTFVDNFGLNASDIDAFGQYAGFRSWYILQHYDEYNRKYKPFRTIVTIYYPFSGKI